MVSTTTAISMQHALMTMALILVFVKMDSREMDSIVQVRGGVFELLVNGISN